MGGLGGVGDLKGSEGIWGSWALGGGGSEVKGSPEVGPSSLLF